MQVAGEMVERKIPNTIISVTKREINEQNAYKLRSLIEQGLSLVVMLSYSGLPQQFEPGVNHSTLAKNFQTLKKYEIPTVHYWRPFLPANSSLQSMERVIDIAGNVPHVTLGLSLNEQIYAAMLPYWAELDQAVDNQSGDILPTVLPLTAVKNLARLKDLYPDHSFFMNASCAITLALNETHDERSERRADYAGTFGSELCKIHNHCPSSQRNGCLDANCRPSTMEVLSQANKFLKRLGQDCHVERVQLRENATPIIWVDGKLDPATSNSLRNSLNCQVLSTSASESKSSPYAFAQQTYGTLREVTIPLQLDLITLCNKLL